MKSDVFSGIRILLVDDNPNGLTVRKLILEEQGFGVTPCGTAELAWDLFRTQRFDVVVTDYRLPGMTGGELIRMIRDTDSPARVVLLSGFIGALGLTAENTGADELILKTNKEVPELLRVVRKLAMQSPRRRPPASSRSTAKKKAVGGL